MEKYVLSMFLISGFGSHNDEHHAKGLFHDRNACWKFVEMINDEQRPVEWIGLCITEKQFRQEYPTMTLDGAQT